MKKFFKKYFTKEHLKDWSLVTLGNLLAKTINVVINMAHTINIQKYFTNGTPALFRLAKQKVAKHTFPAKKKSPPLPKSNTKKISPKYARNKAANLFKKIDSGIEVIENEDGSLDIAYSEIELNKLKMRIVELTKETKDNLLLYRVR